MSKDVELATSAGPEVNDDSGLAPSTDIPDQADDERDDAAADAEDGAKQQSPDDEVATEASGESEEPSKQPDLGDRVNALVKAILERLVPETQRITATLAEVDQRTVAMETRVSGIGNFARSWTDELLAQERKRSAAAFDKILAQVIYPMHDQLFTKICAMESGEAAPEPHLLNLMQNLEGCLERIDVVVIRPQPGEPFELTHMESMEAVPCRFFRRPDTVARVHRCGFALGHHGHEEIGDDATTVLRKSLVDVYRKN